MNDRETLIRAYQSGQLLKALQAALSPDQNEQAKLTSVLLDLHNEKLVDLVAAFGELTEGSAPGTNFFGLRHVFEELLPDLEAPMPKLTRCLLSLYREAGADMAAGKILDAFREFCERGAERSQAALAEIEADPENLHDLLVPVLIAGSRVNPGAYVGETMRLSRHANLNLRRRALFALGHLSGEQVIWDSEDVAKTLEHAVNTDNDDQVLASAIKSAFALLRHDAANESRWVAVIGAALSKGGEIALYAGSEVFGCHTHEVSPELLGLLLGRLAVVKPSQQRTLNNIDYGIAHMLTSDQAEAGLRFLEDLLRAHPEELELSSFDDAVRAIRDNPALRSRVVTRWLLGGEAALCEGLGSIVHVPMGGALEIEADAGELVGVDPVRFVFAARKAIGYFFLQPTSASSFLLSLMGQSRDAEVRGNLEALLLNPLLMNFSRSLAEYVSRREESEEGEVKAALRRALKGLGQYLDDLETVGSIPALHPSLAHREIYWRHLSKEVAQSFKQAQEESVMLQLVHRSVLLYGKKAVHHVFGPEGEINRMETHLGELGTQIDVPRMTILDPCGLDLMLRTFRRERMSA
jgi:hypothetical protein